MIQNIRGFRDILPEDTKLWQKIEKIASELFKDFGFKEIRIPIIEKSDLFVRSIGQTTDIVEKEMYTFEDRKGDKLTLRPEATASIVRSYIQYKMYAVNPIKKLYTIGPMFRRERPQKGRFRQFYQINAEVFGISSPYIDAQLILMLNEFFKRLGIRELNAHINSLGCFDCRPVFQKVLKKFLGSKKDMLCSNCKTRMQENPLRTLDCKALSCKKALYDAPSILNLLCDECSNHFNTVKETLDKQNINYIVDKNLVRGLDYYSRTAFEIHTNLLGAQSAVAGGGRYDALIKELGGPEIPAIGFAIGFDRLAEILAEMGALGQTTKIQGPDIFIISIGKKSLETGYFLSVELNLQKIKTEINFDKKSLKSLMKKADKLNATYVLIIGHKNLETNGFILRNMNTKEQITISRENTVKEILEHLK
ncbi:MAG: histidine--tRNA ligase [Desulfobacteraceae bacterium 4572_130]|nr:MAG: histidine--tRNA ligase [Desulfobacteraceae bacterium 4572_130]